VYVYDEISGECNVPTPPLPLVMRMLFPFVIRNFLKSATYAVLDEKSISNITFDGCCDCNISKKEFSFSEI
jgi:hypothetical protein